MSWKVLRLDLMTYKLIGYNCVPGQNKEHLAARSGILLCQPDQGESELIHTKSSRNPKEGASVYPVVSLIAGNRWLTCQKHKKDGKYRHKKS